MFRFYKLYSLYLKNMANRGAPTAMEWCLCEKLPRAVLHIPLDQELRCEVCGLARRPSAVQSFSSSDERQRMRLERRRTEETLKPNGFQWCYNKRKRNVQKLRESKTAPPPSPPSEHEDVPYLVAMAREVNRPIHERKHWPIQFRNLCVSDFIPLESPITDPSGGAISKQRFKGRRPLHIHHSHPRQPLSKILADILDREKEKQSMQQAKVQDPMLSSHSSQFTPYDHYEGPSEDALVEESAYYMLNKTKLHIEPRLDLPSPQLSTFDSELRSSCNFPAKKCRSRMKYKSMNVTTQTSFTKTASSVKSNPQHEESEKKEAVKDEDESQQNNIYKAIQTPNSPLSLISNLDEVFWTPVEKSSVNNETQNLIENLSIQTTILTPLKDDNNVDPNLAVNVVSNECLNKSITDAMYFPPLPRKWSRSWTAGSTRLAGIAPREQKVSTTKWPNGCTKCGLQRNIRSGTDLPTKDFKNISATREGQLKKHFETLPRSHRKCDAVTQEKCELHSPVATSEQSVKNLGSSSSSVNSEEVVFYTPNSNCKRSNIHSDDRALFIPDHLNIPEIIPRHERLCNVNNNNHSKAQSEAGKQNIDKTSASSSRTVHKTSCPFYNSSIEVPAQNVDPQIGKSEMCLNEENPNSDKETICSSKPNIFNPKAARVKPRHIQLQNMWHNLRYRTPMEPLKHYLVQTFETVRHVCTKIVVPKMVSFFLEEVFPVKSIELEIKQYWGTYEFRTPDIQPNDLSDIEKTVQSNIESPKQQITEFRRQRKKSKTSAVPVWPSHPFKYRKRRIKYEEMELTCQGSQTEIKKSSKIYVENELQYEMKSSTECDNVLQQKLNEMMRKPIKLLKPGEVEKPLERKYAKIDETHESHVPRKNSISNVEDLTQKVELSYKPLRLIASMDVPEKSKVEYFPQFL